jgi:hypothetical protein
MHKYRHACVHIYIYVCVCVRVCACMCGNVCACEYTSMDTQKNTAKNERICPYSDKNRSKSKLKVMRNCLQSSGSRTEEARRRGSRFRRVRACTCDGASLASPGRARMRMPPAHVARRALLRRYAAAWRARRTTCIRSAPADS